MASTDNKISSEASHDRHNCFFSFRMPHRNAPIEGSSTEPDHQKSSSSPEVKVETIRSS
jgi:hypothetical protein